MNPWTLTATGGPAELDLAELRRALDVLPDKAAGVELRALPSAAFAVCRGDDEGGMVAAVERLAPGASGIYYCLNPINPSLEHRARVGDVLKRRWLLVDVDPLKADKDASATDAEKEQAAALAQQCRDFLDGLGWPAPVLVDSGNGFHLLYRLDEPHDAATAALLKRVLHHLHGGDWAGQSGAVIDRATHNASRVAKLPGTMARKGVSAAERPHRPVRLLHVPDPLEAVPRALLEALAGAGGPGDRPPPTSAAPPDPWALKATQGAGAVAYARKCLDKACQAVRLTVPGPAEGRNNRTNKEAYGMGGFVGAGLLLRQEVESALFYAATQAGLPQAEARATIQSGIVAGMAAPRVVPEANGAAGAPGAAAVPAGESVIVRAKAVRTRKVQWLWPGRIPLGKLTTFAGRGGLGKTFVLCDVCARVSGGLTWPDSPEGECVTAADVLFISGEDEPDDTLVPRLTELGADLGRVAFLRTEVLDRFTLADLATLDRALGDMGQGVRLVAIDPPTAYLGEVNDHKNAELRGLLGPLQRWAARNRLAVVFNTHVTKPGAVRVDAMMRVMGSVAWVNAVRAAHMFVDDPDDPQKEKAFFIPMKSNLSKRKRGLTYRIAGLGNELARVEWLGEVDTTADEAMARSCRPRAVVASEWLKERFAEKREWPSDELFRAAHAAGVSRNAVFEAKQQLALPKARKVIHENGNTEWVWWVPEGWPETAGNNPPLYTPGQSGQLEENPFE